MVVVIIEDEPLLASELEQTLYSLNKSIQVVKKLTSVKESIEWLEINKCDLIFSDIELTDGLSFSIFSKVNYSAPIIFTTAYNQYAIKAFELNSIGYLLKPYDIEDLEKVLNKYGKLAVKDSQLNELIHSMVSIEKKNSYHKRLVLSLGNIQKPVDICDIVYFMAEDRYLFAITNDNKKYYFDSTLAKLEEAIDPDMFFRISRKFTINKKFVDEIVTVTSSRLELRLLIPCSEKLVVSYSKVSDFKKWIIS